MGVNNKSSSWRLSMYKKSHGGSYNNCNLAIKLEAMLSYCYQRGHPSRSPGRVTLP